MSKYIRNAFGRVRTGLAGSKRLLAVLVIALCLLPTTARAVDSETSCRFSRRSQAHFKTQLEALSAGFKR